MNAPDKTKKELLDLKSQNVRLECVNLKIPGNKASRQISGADKSQPQSFILTAPSVIFYLDRKYKILAINSEAEQINGFGRKDILDKNYLELFVPEIIREKISKNVEKKPGGDQACVFENYIKCVDGTERLFSWELNRISGGEELSAGIVAVGKDITDQQRSYELAGIQRDLAIKLSAVTELEEGLSLCLETAICASEMDCGGIYLVDENSGALKIAVHQGLSAEFVKSVSYYDYDMDLENITLTMKGEPVYTGHKQLDALFNQTQKNEGLRAIAIVPVLNEGRVIGCLNIASHVFDKINAQSRLALETIAAQIGSTVVRLKTAKALRESEERLRLAVQSAQLCTWDWDLLTEEVWLGGYSAEVLGLDSDVKSIPTSSFMEHIKIEDLERIRQAAEQAINERIPYNEEYRIVQPDSTERWIAAQGQVIYDKAGKAVRMSGVNQDITERKKAVEALRESEKKYRLLFENTSMHVSFWSVKDWRILAMNTEGARKIGKTPEEVTGKTIDEVFCYDPVMAEKAKKVFEEVFESGKGCQTLDCVELLNGTKYWFRSDIQPLKNENGQIIAIQILSEDITEQKKTEEQLYKSEERFKVLFESAPDAYYIHDLECNMIDINKAAEELVGYSRDEIIGNNFLELNLATEEDIPEVVKALADNQQGKAAGPLELALYRKDGGKCIVESRSYPVEIDGQTLVLGIARDITGRKRLEEAYHRLVDNSIQGLAILQDKRIVFLNKAFSSITGYRKEDILAMSPEQLILCVHPDDRDMVWSRHRDRLAGKQLPNRYEYRWMRKDGSFCWIEIHATRIEYQDRPAIQVTFIETTERKKAQEALKASKEFAEKIIETANAIVVVIDTDGNINIFNKFAEELTGYQKEEVLGKNWFDLFISENEKESISEVFKKVLDDSPETLSYENYIVTKSGEKRLISWNNRSIRDNAGTIIGNISIGMDVTERRKAEEKLIAYQSQLRSLASELSLAEERQRRHIATELHDQISQTLALSKINLQSLGQSAGLTNDSMFTEVIESIKETIEQVRSLTFDLSSPTLYKFGLEKAIDELLDDYIKKMGVSYILNVDTSDKPLEQDIMVLLFQSVRELLINIVKHAQAQKVIVTIDRNGYNIRITVCDDGMGFEAEQFESYEQRTGGFGLFNIRERLSYINGSFKIDSKPGVGSQIILTAPLKIKTDSAKGDF